uniref:Ovule protein n=1 Tax=Romanomermis culicivorax TaxID=13658 RepID=A0A915KZH9_ROMCU
MIVAMYLERSTNLVSYGRPDLSRCERGKSKPKFYYYKRIIRQGMRTYNHRKEFHDYNWVILLM